MPLIILKQLGRIIMSNNESKWYKSNWTIGIVSSALIPAILTITIDYFKTKPFLTTFGEWWNWSWSLLIFILNFEIKVWWLLVLTTFCFFVIKLIIIRRANKESKYPPYNEGLYNNILWKWRYYDHYGELRIAGLEPHCPKCRTQLNVDSSFARVAKLNCIRCKDNIFYFIKFDDTENIEKLILGNIENNFYPKSIDAKSPLTGSNS